LTRLVPSSQSQQDLTPQVVVPRHLAKFCADPVRTGGDRVEVGLGVDVALRKASRSGERSNEVGEREFHFSRRFRAHFGVPPRDYRKQRPG
jgi:AraC-like DNA-binding protein